MFPERFRRGPGAKRLGRDTLRQHRRGPGPGGTDPTVHDDVEAVPMSAPLSGQEQLLAAARRAARDLAAAVEKLTRTSPPNVDLRRLAEDTARISVDLDLLTGTRSTPQPAVTLEIVQDVEYPASLFEDADDEGLGPRRR
jgi:hypothetical protein